MTDRPIIFTGDSVRSILEGRKTQTRRVVKPQPLASSVIDGVLFKDDSPEQAPCPYGQPGRDRLWVRETWQISGRGDVPIYRADYADLSDVSIPWRSPIYMPRWASRITLEIVSVRVERVQEISGTDAIEEGVSSVEFYPDEGFPLCVGFMMGKDDGETGLEVLPESAFRRHWNAINRRRGFGWDLNPWVYRIEFRRVENA